MKTVHGQYHDINLNIVFFRILIYESNFTLIDKF